jgi:hypothetical protein
LFYIVCLVGVITGWVVSCASGDGSLPLSETSTNSVSRVRIAALLLESTKDNRSFAASRDEIVKLGAAAEEGLVSRLAATNVSERANAVTFLGLIKSEKSIPFIFAKKRDPEIAVRMAAIEALWCFQNPEHIDKLAEAFLKDQHPSVRDVAVITLGKYRHEKALPHLVAALDDTDDYARECARKGLESFAGKNVDGKDEKEKNKGWKAWYSNWKEEHENKNAGK